jgi:hypothetical protein
MNIDEILGPFEDLATESSNEDYAAEFAEMVASQCDPDTAGKVVVACYTRFVNSTASNFLDEFLKLVQIESLDEILLDCIVLSVDAAGSIVDYLLTFAGLSETDLADRLLNRLAIARDDQSQYCLSYGLWVLICSRTFNEDHCLSLWTYSASDSATINLRSRIENALSNLTLSAPSRARLEACIKDLASKEPRLFYRSTGGIGDGENHF